MICRVIDDRVDWFTLLGRKLGDEVTFCQSAAADLGEGETQPVIIAVPSPEHPLHDERLRLLSVVADVPLGVPVIAFLPEPDRELIKEVIADGASDYFVETGSMDELRHVLRRAEHVCELRREINRLRDCSSSPTFGKILSSDPCMQATCSLAAKVAASDATVLLTGESGTGKELLARAIHESSPRAGQPFVAVACSSLPETLIESELFGHEKGAFTGAFCARSGRFEAAGRGSIFLDEIGELPAAIQVKLLRVLQERTIERLGSNRSRAIEARIICATNRPLRELTKIGEFRADLFYRLSTVEIEVPPLRQRRDDILLLACSMLRKYAEREQRPARTFSAGAMSALQLYDWPGNVRELQNVVERAVVICDGAEIRCDHLPTHVVGRAAETQIPTFEEEVRAFKRHLIEQTLLQCGNNKSQAAKTLKIPRSSLHRLIDELEVKDHAAACD